MSQINVDPGTPGDNDPNSSARGAATNNLTWAIAMVLVIAAMYLIKNLGAGYTEATE